MRILILIFITSFYPLILHSQVGIQTEFPEQALHVKGKVKVGDDGLEPTRGTIRYSDKGDFEGYSSNGWESLTHTGQSTLPTNPVPVFGYHFGVSVGESNQLVDFKRFSNLSTFTSVPNNQYLIITSILIEPNSAAGSGTFIVTVGRADGPSIDQLSAIRLTGDEKSKFYQDPMGLLMIVKPNEVLRVTNENLSGFGVNVKVRGFLVDDLNY